MAYIKPAGQVRTSPILANRDTGAIYVMVDGRLHPTNLISARLISGTNANPTFVKSNEIDKYPQGPKVGIIGAPDEMPIRTGLDSEWAIGQGPSRYRHHLIGQGPGRHGDRRAAERRAPVLGAADHAQRRPGPAQR